MTPDEAAEAAREDERRLTVAIESNERYRARARAVATLIAAAAGALAAAIVLAPPAASPPVAQWIGAGAVALLILSTCAFIGASLAYTSDHAVKYRTLRILSLVFMFWRIVLEEAPGATILDMHNQARGVQKRIRGAINAGAILAGVGVISLGACLYLVAFDQQLSVLVSVSNSSDLRSSCPKFAQGFAASVARSDLSGTAAEIPVNLSAVQCGSDHDLVVFVERSTTVFALENGR